MGEEISMYVRRTCLPATYITGQHQFYHERIKLLLCVRSEDADLAHPAKDYKVQDCASTCERNVPVYQVGCTSYHILLKSKKLEALPR